VQKCNIFTWVHNPIIEGHFNASGMKFGRGITLQSLHHDQLLSGCLDTLVRHGADGDIDRPHARLIWLPPSCSASRNRKHDAAIASAVIPCDTSLRLHRRQ
jgi:hypothetical protein